MTARERRLVEALRKIANMNVVNPYEAFVRKTAIEALAAARASSGDDLDSVEKVIADMRTMAGRVSGPKRVLKWIDRLEALTKGTP